jgi:hypothetical protein
MVCTKKVIYLILGFIGNDRVIDFKSGQDKISLDRTTFRKLKGSKVKFAVAKTLRKASKVSAPIVYVQSKGDLFYNSNGTAAGFGTGGQFADLKNRTPLTGQDFTIIP